MRAHFIKTGGFHGLKDYVYRTLCHHEKLEVGVFPMTQKILKRRATPCGMYFCLHGPRSVKFTAIWDAERNTVLFYDATGQRFLKMELPAAAGQEPSAA
jgi:hypothetical protein